MPLDEPMPPKSPKRTSVSPHSSSCVERLAAGAMMNASGRWSPVERRAARPCRGGGEAADRHRYETYTNQDRFSPARRQQHPRPPAPCTSGSAPHTRALHVQLRYVTSHRAAVADITAGPALMLGLACASPVAACRLEPRPPWERSTGHAALEAPACLPLRWAAGAADLRLGWPKQAGRAGAGW